MVIFIFLSDKVYAVFMALPIFAHAHFAKSCVKNSTRPHPIFEPQLQNLYGDSFATFGTQPFQQKFSDSNKSLEF